VIMRCQGALMRFSAISVDRTRLITGVTQER
jgi:hypothetical protein